MSGPSTTRCLCLNLYSFSGGSFECMKQQYKCMSFYATPTKTRAYKLIMLRSEIFGRRAGIEKYIGKALWQSTE